MGEAEAVALSDFLVPMLAPDPLKRQGAKQMLDHPWLRMRSPEDELAYCEMVSTRFIHTTRGKGGGEAAAGVTVTTAAAVCRTSS